MPDEIRKGAKANRGFESLALRTNADGVRELWAIMELNLEGEGENISSEAGTRCRVVVFREEKDEGGNDAFVIDRELFYETAALPRSIVPIGKVNSVAEACTFPDGSLVVLERSATALGGYNGVFYLASETEGQDILTKKRITSIREIAGGRLPWTGNFEGVCVGPPMAELTGNENERGYLMVFIADDNFGADHQRGTQIMAVRMEMAPRLPE